MGINFFENEQKVKDIEKFGIIDPAQNKSNTQKTAYISYAETDGWNVSVISNYRDNLFFNAIDGNIIFYREVDSHKEKERSCDAMIHSDDIVIFIEIKNWKTKHKDKVGKKLTFWESAIEQLENTIVHFCKAHPDKNYNKKYAYISNKHKPSFEFSNKTTQQIFNNNTNGFILKVSALIDFEHL